MNAHPETSSKILPSILLTLSLLLPQAKAINVLMQHNDLSRTGANTAETILTPTNVATSFGRLFTNAVDGQVYAQPLYVQNVSISNGVHNVVFVCTESNSVWAFDADMPHVAYWHDNFGPPYVPPTCGDLTPAVGITGTPVIDPDSGTLYVVSKLASGPEHLLHALDITTGSEKFGGAVTVTTTGFVPAIEHQRTGLLLMSNVVYFGFGSHCDQSTYHGYVFGYNATNLTLLYHLNITPTGSQGAVWSGGMAPAVDTNGNIYVITGNGTYDGVNNFGMCMLKLSPTLAVLDYATATNESTLSGQDLDFGSGGGVLIPPHYLVGIGKDTNLFMADINNMGHQGNFAQVVYGAEAARGDTVGKSPVYWQGPSLQYLFLAHANNPIRLFQFNGTNIVTPFLGQSAFPANDRVGGISLSANGTTNGVLWEIDNNNILRAYDAVNFPHVLWSGSIGTYVKMNCPTIANGKVYVGTASSLIVFGLTNYLYLQSGVSNPVLSWAPGGTLQQSTNLPGTWISVSNNPPYSVVPTNDQMFYRLSLP